MEDSFKIWSPVKVAKIGRGILVKMTPADFGDVDAIWKIAENMTLPLRPQEVSSPLANRTPKGKEGLVNALGHLTSHSLPLGSPSLARFCNTESPVSIAHVGNSKAFLFKEPRLFVQMIDGVEN